MEGVLPEQNSVAKAELEKVLTEPLTVGYRPTIPLWAMGRDNEPMPQFYLMLDVERMMIHSHVHNCLELYKSGISGAEFWGGPNTDMPEDPNGLPICPENPEVGQFVQQQCNRFWDRGVPKLQNCAYPYGWGAGENLYSNENGLEWDDLTDFSPCDSFLLTLEERPVGVQVKQIQSPGGDSKGTADLWFATKDVPAKALWYAHNPRYNQFYGQSQLLRAWRDWRRLATKNAAETVLDGGMFRLGYCAPLIRYPEEAVQTAQNLPGTFADSQGGRRREARDLARFISEQMQAGAGWGMSSKKYMTEEGGGYKWDVDWPKYEFDGTHLIAYILELKKCIAAGIGVPFELLEAMEGGSGYSGRAIPMEAFLTQQQRIADAMLRIFVQQVLRPLVRWRFGEVRFNVEVKPLLLTKRKQQAGGDLGTKPGVNPGMPPPAMPNSHQGNSHHPQVGNNPPPGQMDNPLSPTSQAGTMFSMNQDRVRNIANLIRSLGKAA